MSESVSGIILSNAQYKDTMKYTVSKYSLLSFQYEYTSLTISIPIFTEI